MVTKDDLLSDVDALLVLLEQKDDEIEEIRSERNLIERRLETAMRLLGNVTERDLELLQNHVSPASVLKQTNGLLK